MSKKLKEMMVREMTGRFAGLERGGCVVVNFSGLNASESAGVRAALAQKGASMTVIRNRLFALALQELGVPELARLIKGPTAVVTGDDPITIAKAVEEVARSTPSITLVGGLAEGQVLEPTAIQKLAALPSREALLSMVLTCIVSPAQRFVNALSATTQKLASVMDEYRKKREQEEGPGQEA